jgi:hypothetical protein
MSRAVLAAAAVLTASVLAFAGSSAEAQGVRGGRPLPEPKITLPSPPALTGDPIKDIGNAIAGANASGGLENPGTLTPDQLWAKIQSANVNDLKYAKALADNAASSGSKLRSACYGAWITAIEQQQGVGLKDASGNPLTMPDPHLFSTFEQLAEIADGLAPTGPLMSACAPAWTALKLTATQFFTTAVTGAVGLSALGVTIP